MATVTPRFRGLAKVQAQCLLSAACQNMKKMALLLARRDVFLLLKILAKPRISASFARLLWLTWASDRNARIRLVSA